MATAVVAMCDHPASFRGEPAHFGDGRKLRRFWNGRRFHELANSIKNDFEMGVVFLFQLFELSGEVFMSRQEFSNPDKCTDIGSRVIGSSYSVGTKNMEYIHLFL